MHANNEVFIVFTLDLLKPLYSSGSPDQVQARLIRYEHLHLDLRLFWEGLGAHYLYAFGREVKS